MSVNIEMPKLSDTMTDGTLVKWHKKIGDQVAIGDILAEIETDKATMEMEAFDDGVMTDILIPEGGQAPIGAIIAVLDGTVTPTPKPSALVQAAPADPPCTQPTVQPTAIAAPRVQPFATSSQRIIASPLARKIAAEISVDLSSITGSGPGGRITKTDVEAAALVTTAKPTITPSTEAAAAAALVASLKSKPLIPAVATAIVPQAILPLPQPGDEILELSTIRKIIATRLVTSKTTIPHFYLHLEVDAGPLLSLRRQINEQTEHTHGNKYSVNDFILKAVVNATLAVPAVNASFANNQIVRYKHLGLAIAIALADGLVTPVIKEAETKSLLVISQTVKDFATRAKEQKLKPDEFDGGTITVSNLGAWGIESFDAIINPPQALILAVGATIEKPVVKHGQIVAGLRMNLGLSCDHRVIDGALGARYLKQIKDLLEKPALMLL